MVTSKIRSG